MNPSSTTSPAPSLTSASALLWGSPQWLAVAGVLMGVVLLLLAWNYSRAQARPTVRACAALLKAVGFAVLIFSLVEPLLTGSRPKPGANAFVVLVDNSQSLQIRDANAIKTRGDWIRDHLRDDLAWRTRLAQDFDVRPYLFDSHLRGVENFNALSFDGTGSTLGASLAALNRRFRGLPLAGVLVLTDGNRTDLGPIDVAGLPPIYPVIPPPRVLGATSGSATSRSARPTSRPPRSSSAPRSPPPASATSRSASSCSTRPGTRSPARKRRRPTADGTKPLAFPLPVSPRQEGRSVLSRAGPVGRRRHSG